MVTKKEEKDKDISSRLKALSFTRLMKTPEGRLEYTPPPSPPTPSKETARPEGWVPPIDSPRDFYAQRLYAHISENPPDTCYRLDELLEVIGKNSRSTLRRAIIRGQELGWWVVDTYYCDAQARKYGRKYGGTYFTLKKH